MLYKNKLIGKKSIFLGVVECWLCMQKILEDPRFIGFYNAKKKKQEWDVIPWLYKYELTADTYAWVDLIIFYVTNHIAKNGKNDIISTQTFIRIRKLLDVFLDYFFRPKTKFNKNA